MKANDILNTMLVLSVLIFLGLGIKYLFFAPEPNHVIGTKIERDTVTVKDTIRIPKYIYVTKLQARIDTIFVDSSKVLVARADTALQKDSSKIKVSYYFPPKNLFEIALEIKERIIREFQTVTETKTIITEEPWYRDMWFYSTMLSLVILFLVK